MHMFFDSTIADVKAAILAAIPRLPLTATLCAATVADFDLCTVFPRRTYDDGTATLVAVGLTPNGTLHIRPRAAKLVPAPID